MTKTYPPQYICEHRMKEAFENTIGMIGAIYEIPCERDMKCPNQPERSKREDVKLKVPCEKCWEEIKKYAQTCVELYGIAMRCSEHCG